MRHPHLALACFVATVALPVFSFPPNAYAQTDPTVIFDREFLESNWSVVGSFNNGSSETHERRTTGGNPDAYRHMEHTNPGIANLSVTHEFTGASYDPSTQGAIGGIDYSADRIELDPPFVGAAIGARFALFQDGRRYLSSAVTTFTNTDWELHRLNCLQPEDFNPIGERLPDFSASGSPMTFGYLRSNSNNSANVTLVTKNGIDNFRIALYPSSNPDCSGGPPDVRVSKSDGMQTWAFDPVVSYEIDVTNVGGSPVPVELREIIPINSEFRPAASSPGWICETDRGGSRCTIDLGELDQDESVTVDFVVEVINAAPIAFGLFNEASIDAGGEISAVEVTDPGPCDLDNIASDAACCILCILFPDTCAEFAAAQASVSAIVEGLTDAMSTEFDFNMLYRIRDRHMVDTRGGRRATELFYDHNVDLKRAALTDPDIIGLGREALGAWEDNLNALAAGSGAAATVDQGQIDSIDAFLDKVRDVAELNLRVAIDRERPRLVLSDWVGIDMIAALARLDRLTCKGFEDTLFCGELNGDCVISATDALLALTIAVGLLSEQAEADVNGSGSTNAQDALLILRQAIGLDPPTTDCNVTGS